MPLKPGVQMSTSRPRQHLFPASHERLVQAGATTQEEPGSIPAGHQGSHQPIPWRQCHRGSAQDTTNGAELA